MAARGQISKSAITEIILNTFMDSFINGKEIRIPMTEDGAEVQIKVTLTAAKDNVPHGVGTAVNPIGALPKQEVSLGGGIKTESEKLEPTEDEKKTLAELISAMKQRGSM